MPKGHAFTAVAFAVVAGALVSGCEHPRAQPMSAPRPPAAYDLERPDVVLELPRSLTEISGLTALEEGRLGAVQDEKGRLYILDVKTGNVVREARFGKDGDYEDLELTPDGLFILESNGTLHRIDDWRADTLDATPIKTGLTARHDTEGLAYDARHNLLLIACKEFAGPGLKNKRAIYAYDMATGALLPEPVYIIDLEAIAHLESHPLNRAIRTVLGPLLDAGGFKPAAIAIHPFNRQLYTVSSVMKSAVVLSPDGELLAAVPIPDRLFRQPEGMAFTENGDLYIANEGGEGRATLLRFKSR
jgi:uncharacterized protein YjiK